jgi:hypothetical protein
LISAWIYSRLTKVSAVITMQGTRISWIV